MPQYEIKDFRVNVLPGVGVPNARYYVLNGTDVDLYITDLSGAFHKVVSPVLFSAGTTSELLTNVTFANSNNVSFGINNGIVTASFAGGGGGSMIISAGTTSQSLNNLVFADSNGVSFGLNGSTVTATVKTDYMLSNAGSDFVNTSQSTLFQPTSLMSNYQLTGNYLTTAMLSNAGSNFVQANAGLFGTNITGTIGSNGISLSVASQTPQSVQPVAASANNGSFNYSTLKFVDTFGVSWVTSTDGIRASVQTNYLTTAAQSNQVVNSINGNTGQFSLNVGSSLSSSVNGNSYTFGLASNITTALQVAGNYLTTARASTDAIGLNTAQTNVTWTVNSSGISLNAGGYAGTGFTSTTTAGTAVLGTHNTAGLSMAFPVFITNALTTAAQSNQVVNSINGSTGIFSFNTGSSLSSSRNGNSITWGLASDITTALQSAGNYLTTAAQSNQVVNSINGSTGIFTFNTGSSLSSSRNGNSFTFGLASNITTALQSAGNYLTTAAQSDQVVNSINGSTGIFSFNTGSSLSSSRNGNSITWGLASNITTALQSAGNYLTTARASTDAVGLNTAQTNVTWTVNSSGISINAGGYAGTGTTFNGANISASMTQNSNGLALSMSVAAPGAAAEANWHHLLGANTAGNTTASGSTIGLSGSEITLSGTNNSQINLIGNTFSNSNNITFGKNAGTITASYQEPLQSYFEYLPYQGTTAFSLGGSSAFVQPFILPFNLSASYLRMANSFLFNSTTAATTANQSLTFNHSNTVWVHIFTKGIGASSKSLQYLTGSSLTWMLQVRCEIGAASNNQTVSHNFTYPSSEGAAQGNFATNYNVNAASFQVSTTHLTSFNNVRWLDIPFGLSLSAGNYWMGIFQSSATATTGGIGFITNAFVRNTYYAISQISTNIAAMGVSSNMSTAPMGNGLGYWSTNTLGASTSSMGLASISTVANQPRVPFQLIREA